MARFAALFLPFIQAAVVLASPLAERAEPDPSLATSVTVAGQTFVNKVCSALIWVVPMLSSSS